MLKNGRFSLSVLLAAALLGGLTSCGGGNTSSGGDPTNGGNGNVSETTDAGTDEPSNVTVGTAAVDPDALPHVCDLLSPEDVGAVVNRPMSAGPAMTGLGCFYSATDQADIDTSTDYPPYIAQVSLTYNAPTNGVSAEQVVEMWEIARPGNAVELEAPGDGQAYSIRGGDAYLLDDGVFISCSTRGTMRPESAPEVQGMCLAIAELLLAALEAA